MPGQDGNYPGPLSGPRRCSPDTWVGRIWVTRARRECGPAIYRLPARTPQFILLSRRDRQVVDELKVLHWIYQKTTKTVFRVSFPIDRRSIKRKIPEDLGAFDESEEASLGKCTWRNRKRRPDERTVMSHDPHRGYGAFSLPILFLEPFWRV